MAFIPVNTPSLEGNEKRYLNECVDTGWISSEGPFVRRFEEGIAARVQRAHGIAVCNGSVALDVALAALDIGPGDEVILPSLTIISCAAAIVRLGAVPVTVDADPRTWNMDVAQLEALITPRTRAIMVVHIYGLPVDLDPILELAKKHGLRVVEDAAEVLGQTYRGRPCGSFGDLSTFSFYPNKHVTTGEGGMVVTNDAALAARCQALRNLCFGKEDRFVHEELGWNFRMTNLQAAVGCAQLEQLERAIPRKREIGRMYTELLADTEGVQLPLAETDYAQNIYWVYGLVLTEATPLNAKSAMARLTELGVGTRPFFHPINRQPVLRKMGFFADTACPVAERLAARGFYVPSGLGLTDAQIVESAAAVKKMLAA